MNSRRYPAKVLLFGEYSVIVGSEALALPVHQFGAEWDFTAVANDSHHQLSLLLAYLKSSVFKPSQFLNINGFKDALDQGIYLKSNIPNGYGLGSSGSVCAAVFDRFKSQQASELSQSELRFVLSQMENYFHGNSSGLDPLVSFLDKPVIVQPNQHISVVENGSGFHKGIDVYVYDSGMPRKTEPLVKHFKDKLNDPEFEKLIKIDLNPLVHSLIEGWLTNENAVFEKMRKLSEWQIRYLPELFPESILELIDKMHAHHNFIFKLCGAGGGGFYLVFTQKGTPVPSIINQGLIKISP